MKPGPVFGVEATVSPVGGNFSDGLGTGMVPGANSGIIGVWGRSSVILGSPGVILQSGLAVEAIVATTLNLILLRTDLLPENG